MKALWLALPLLLVIGLDGLFTLRGQPEAYRKGTLSATNEACPIGRVALERGPKAFAIALACWAGAALLLSRILPGLLGQAFYGSVLLAHAWGSASWIPLEARRDLKGIATSLTRAPDLGYVATLAYLVLLSVVTVFCWRRAGLLAAETPKPKKKEAKG